MAGIPFNGNDIGQFLFNFSAISTARVTLSGDGQTATVTFTDPADIAAPDCCIDALAGNAGSATLSVQVAFGSNAAVVPNVTPQKNSNTVQPGQCKIFRKGAGVAQVNLIASGGAITVDVSAGYGS